MTAPADELRAAAEKLRALAKAIDVPDLPEQSWHVEACASEERGDCPCIVAQGEYREFDQPQIPPMRYIADAETPELAAYIAAMHPEVGLLLADWLDATVTEVTTVEGTEYALHPDGGMFPGWDAALAVARAILGSHP